MVAAVISLFAMRTDYAGRRFHAAAAPPYENTPPEHAPMGCSSYSPVSVNGVPERSGPSA